LSIDIDGGPALAAGITNAICNATGVGVLDSSITPEKHLRDPPQEA
jgi:CO/xanthine dehydrogenase Mo-binding subunit